VFSGSDLMAFHLPCSSTLFMQEESLYVENRGPAIQLLQLLLDTLNRKPGITFTSEPSRLHTCGGRGRVWAVDCGPA